MQAQSFIVNTKSGSTFSTMITQVRSISFVGSTLSVNKQDGTSELTPINQIKFLNFTGNTAINTPTKKLSTYNVYPNPVRDILSIEQKGESLNSLINIDILSIDGKLIYSDKTDNSHYTINTSSWMKGLYLLRVRNGNEIITNKIMKN